VKAVVLAFGLVSLLFAQDDLNSWQINSSTDSLTLVSVENRDTNTVFSLKNTGQKPIAGFSIALGRAPAGRDATFDIQEVIDCFDRESECVAPGATYSMAFPTRNVDALSDKIFRISAAVFDDGTGEGSPVGLNFISSMRLGSMIETERILSLLADPTGAKERIGGLPQSVEEALASLDGVVLPGISMTDVMARFTDVHNQIGRQGFIVGIQRPLERALGEVNRPEPVVSDLQHSYQALSTAHKDFCGKTLNCGLLP